MRNQLIKSWALILLALALSSCDPWRQPVSLEGVTAQAKDITAAQNFSLPPMNTNGAAKKNLWATYYYVYQAKEQMGLALLNKNNQAFTPTISTKDFCLGGIEGTLMITSKSGKQITYNYADAKGPQQADCAEVLGWSEARTAKNPWIKATGKIRYQFAGNRFGTGVKGYQLQPFRSIAVDAKHIPYGTAIYVPAAKGLNFSHDGRTYKHDGYFFAADTGGAIKENHIDIFQGLSKRNAWPSLIGSTPEATFKAYKVTNPKIISAFQTLHQAN